MHLRPTTPMSCAVMFPTYSSHVALRKTGGRFFRDYQTLWWRAFGLMTWESFLSKKNGEKIDDLGKVERPPITDLSQVIRTEYIYYGNMVINKWFITYNWGLKWIHDVCDGITTPWSCPGFRSDQLRSAPSCGWADITPLSDGGTTYIQSWLSQRFILCDQTWRHMTDDCRWFSQLGNRWT